MRKFVLLLIALFLPTTAHAGQTLCFRLADDQNPQLGYVDFKLAMQPPCKVTAPDQADQAPRISSVHGISQGFDQGGQPTEGFLIAGTCEADTVGVGLVAPFLGGGSLLVIFGPSFDTAIAQLGPLTGPVVPAKCGDLDL